MMPGGRQHRRLLRRLEARGVVRGQVLAKPGDQAHTQFKAQVYVLSKEEAAVTPRSSRGTARSSYIAPPSHGEVKLPEGSRCACPATTA